MEKYGITEFLSGASSRFAYAVAETSRTEYICVSPSMTTDSPDVTGIVLAGGRSTRFQGQNKATATLDGQPLLERVVSALADATNERPVVAIRTEEQRDTYQNLLSSSVTYVFDHASFEGPLAGVFAAVNGVETPWVFVCGCDMPLMSTVAVSWLRTHLPTSKQPRPPSDALIVEHPDGTIEPLHAFYHCRAVLANRNHLASTAGLYQLLETFDDVEMIQPSAAPPAVPLHRSLTNINTRDDLAMIANSTTFTDE